MKNLVGWEVAWQADLRDLEPLAINVTRAAKASGAVDAVCGVPTPLMAVAKSVALAKTALLR